MVKIRVEDIVVPSVFWIWRMDGCPDPGRGNGFMATLSNEKGQPYSVTQFPTVIKIRVLDASADWEVLTLNIDTRHETMFVMRDQVPSTPRK